MGDGRQLLVTFLVPALTIAGAVSASSEWDVNGGNAGDGGGHGQSSGRRFAVTISFCHKKVGTADLSSVDACCLLRTTLIVLDETFLQDGFVAHTSVFS